MAEWACQLRETSLFEIKLLEFCAFCVCIFPRCFVKCAIGQYMCCGILRLLLLLSPVLLACSTCTSILLPLICFFNGITADSNVSVNQVLLIGFFLRMLSIVKVVWTLRCHFSFSSPVVLKFFFDTFNDLLVVLKGLEVLGEGKHGSIVCSVFVDIRHLNEECDWC